MSSPLATGSTSQPLSSTFPPPDSSVAFKEITSSGVLVNASTAAPSTTPTARSIAPIPVTTILEPSSETPVALPTYSTATISTPSTLNKTGSITESTGTPQTVTSAAVSSTASAPSSVSSPSPIYSAAIVSSSSPLLSSLFTTPSLSPPSSSPPPPQPSSSSYFSSPLISSTTTITAASSSSPAEAIFAGTACSSFLQWPFILVCVIGIIAILLLIIGWTVTVVYLSRRNKKYKGGNSSEDGFSGMRKDKSGLYDPNVEEGRVHRHQVGL
ncbi:unnamed protein product [Schistocephalus solidus]|uniref:Mid2 domain-containing protein n=1 Tax=Schistocephalus solidus TaxID=70667 RepID=A0A183SBZ0_SCHSO|nr:unnamed protein product [Schistocephalus solidus]